MRVIVCLAVFLVASLSTGEALKCRMCTSEKDTDLCTKNPWIIGVQECGKPGMNMGETLEEIKKQLENKTSTELPDFAKLAGFMETLMVKKPTVGEYIWKVNTTKTDDSKIVSLMKAYGSYAKSATQDEFVTLAEEIKKCKDLGDNVTLDAMVKTEIASAKLVLRKILKIKTDTNYGRQNYAWFTTDLTTIRSGIKAITVAEVQTIETFTKRKAAVTTKIAEWTKLTYLEEKAVTNVENTAGSMGDNDLKKFMDNGGQIAVPYSITILDEQNGTVQQLIDHIDAIFEPVESIQNFAESLTELNNYIEKLENFVKAGKQRTLETLATHLDELKNATTDAIAGLPIAPVNATWTCFKETNDKKIVTKRGCMEKVDKLADGVLVCDDKDGCNSSSIITIGGLPIFLAIAVALGFAR